MKIAKLFYKELGQLIPFNLNNIARPLPALFNFIFGGKAKKSLSRKFVRNTLIPQNFNTPFFIIATPGNLHIVKLCLNFFPSDQQCVLVLNGLNRWERNWAFTNLSPSGFICFPFLIDHWMIIDYLLDWFERPFGLIDEDCFVFDQDCFTKIKYLSNETVLTSYYYYTNSNLAMIFPETMFVFLNTPIINMIKKKYQINSAPVVWEQLHPRAQKELQSIGILKDKLPEDYKPYFDTLRAVMSLSIAENLIFHYPDGDHSLRSDSVYHIGAIASVTLRGLRMNKWDAARGAYFWYRALEEVDDLTIKERYYKKFGHYNSRDLLKLVPGTIKEMFERNNFIDSVERILINGNN
jgi:hypothetical protein